MTRTLILLRHGRTAWNAAGRAQGHADVSLDDVGIAQARRVAPVVAAKRPARLWSSDLARAMQTAAAVGEVCELPVTPEPAFREYALSPARTGLTLAEYEAAYPEEYAALMTGGPVPGRESDAQVTGRFVPALEAAAAELADGEVGVVVSHGAALRTAMTAYVGLPPGAHEAFGGLGNCHWAHLVESVPAIIGGSLRWRLRAWNAAAPGNDPDFTAPSGIG